MASESGELGLSPAGETKLDDATRLDSVPAASIHSDSLQLDSLRSLSLRVAGNLEVTNIHDVIRLSEIVVSGNFKVNMDNVKVIAAPEIEKQLVEALGSGDCRESVVKMVMNAQIVKSKSSSKEFLRRGSWGKVFDVVRQKSLEKRAELQNFKSVAGRLFPSENPWIKDAKAHHVGFSEVETAAESCCEKAAESNTESENESKPKDSSPISSTTGVRKKKREPLSTSESNAVIDV